MRTLNAIWFNPQHERFFSSSKCPDQLWDPPTSISVCIRVSFFAEENGQCMILTTQSPSSAKVENECGYTSTPPKCLHGRQ